jgi:4-hydroxy-tetrahydrodipicolinate reductase
MKLIVHGINGRMGRMLLETAAEDADISVVCGIDKHTSQLEPPIFRGEKVPLIESAVEFAGSADVMIDFSH